jgi:hypothetical protein
MTSLSGTGISKSFFYGAEPVVLKNAKNTGLSKVDKLQLRLLKPKNTSLDYQKTRPADVCVRLTISCLCNNDGRGGGRR